MKIESQDAFVTVTFDNPLDLQGTRDTSNYVLTSSEGVPVAVLDVDVLTNIDATLQGTSSIAAAPTFARPAHLSASSRRSALVSLPTPTSTERKLGAALGASDAPTSAACLRLRANSKLVNGRMYQLEMRGLKDVDGIPYRGVVTFTAQASLPGVVSAVQVDNGRVMVTFSSPMRVDEALTSPGEYSITGPTTVMIRTVRTVANNRVLLTTSGLGSGAYTLIVNAAGTPRDYAGNPIDPALNQTVFTGIAARSSRSVFTDKGPITKPALTLQSADTGPGSAVPGQAGNKATVTPIDANTATVKGLTGMTAESVGRVLVLSGAASAVINGTFLIAGSVFLPSKNVDPTSVVITIAASVADASNGSIVWAERNASATITGPTQLTLAGANFTSQHVGLYIAVSDALNSGVYRITSRVSAREVKVAASFTLPDPANGTFAWRLIDYRDGQIADDPSDVYVRINGVAVEAEEVVGLLGQVVLPSVPAPTDTVSIDYAWTSNPTVDFRSLNSKEFRLNSWGQRPSDSSPHKYRYNSTLLTTKNFVPLDMRASVPQPQQRDLKYRAYERAYSVALNDPNLLLLNSPNHRIAFPPMSRSLKSTFVNYQGMVLPEAAPDPWVRSGTGTASIAGPDLDLVVVDTTNTGPLGGEPIYWTRPLDLTFEHVFAHAWRLQIDDVPVQQGVFTGVATGYSDGEKACVIGFLKAGSTKMIGILRRGFGNDPSVAAAWTGGLVTNTTGDLVSTGTAASVDWSPLRSYRIFRDRSGLVQVYIDGSVVALLRATEDELPFLHELNAPFDKLQGPFFGSLSREAESTSTWSFVRYTSIPVNVFESEPAVFVSYEGDDLPDAAAQPWTPVGFHGTERQVDSHLVLDSTSATNVATPVAGLISGDFKGYTRIEPLLKESFNTVLDVQLALRTYTQGVAPNAVMAAIDDGDRLIQLSFFSDLAAPKLSYGGRTLPSSFQPYEWQSSGLQSADMVGQYLRISDASDSDGLYYTLTEATGLEDATRVLGYKDPLYPLDSDYVFEFRVQVLSKTAANGFCGVSSSVYDGERSVGIQFAEYLNDQSKPQRYVELHSEGVPLPGGRFSFEWFDGMFHTIRVTKSTAGDLVTVFADGTYLGGVTYSLIQPPELPSVVSRATFGSSTPFNVQAQSVVLWAYSNYWRVTHGRRFVGLWKGIEPNSLIGYHLPLRIAGRSAVVTGNVLTDPQADFTDVGVAPNEQLIVDEGPNQGVYTVDSVALQGDVTKLTVKPAFPVQPAQVTYRCVREVDWTSEHRYRILKDPSGVSVFLDTVPAPLIHTDYSNAALPPSSAGIPQVMSAGLPSITWGAFDPTNLSQTSWDFVRFGAVRSISATGLAPHHQILNQRNIISSYEHHRSNIPHTHTDFWSESEGIPPQTEPDLLRDPNLVAYTLLNEGTPLVPSTQAYEVRAPKTLMVPVAGLNSPQDVLNHRGFLVNNAEQRVEVLVPDDILYNSLQVIEGTNGQADLLAPFDDDAQMSVVGPLNFTKEVCLSYDGGVLPENDTAAPTQWIRASDDDSHQSSVVSRDALTYGTDATGTRTIYRNATTLPDATSLRTEVKFRLKLVQDTTEGLGDSEVRVGFSSPGVTVGLAFVTTPIGERYVFAIDLNNGKTLGGVPFDFYDGAYHTYALSRDPSTDSIQIRVEA